MNTVENLLDRARADAAIAGLPNHARRGAEAYFQAYQYVAADNPKSFKWLLRKVADRYLALAATPPLTMPQLKAANLARATLKRLS